MSTNLDSFERTQNLAYEATSAVMKLLHVGMSEKEAAALIDTYCRDSGVKAYFHKPFAWFGNRSRFRSFTNSMHFLPNRTELQVGDMVILDVAPILDGHVADVGHTFLFGDTPNQEHLKARALLLRLRNEIPKLFESELTTAEIWKKVDEEIKSEGLENIHQMYPFSVLGHRVRAVPLGKLSSPLGPFPFGWQSFWSLASNGVFADLLGPKHKGDKTGTWAIEPHVGGLGFGAKFEEILVVEKNDSGKITARWLTDNVPHLKPNWMSA